MNHEAIRTALVDAYWSSRGNAARMTGAALQAAGIAVHDELAMLVEKIIDFWLRVPAPFGGMAQDVCRVLESEAA